jgi:Heparinase II/III-like protein.
MNKIKRILTVLLILIYSLSFMAGCAASKNDDKISGVNNYEDGKFGITLDEFNCQFKLPINDKVISIADGLVGNELTVYYDMESMPYEFDKLDWNVIYSQAPATFQLHLQCLEPVVYLVKAYELTQKEEYINRAKDFLLSWNEYRQNDELTKNNSKVWYDHGTALRAENIIYYALVADKYGKLDQDTKKIIVELLELHGKMLSTESFYTKNHNHGIFQDGALIYIAYFLNDENKEAWVSIAKQRLTEQMNFAFNDERVHVENSPGYQIGVEDLFRVTADFLMQFDDEYGKELYEKVKESTEFMAYITKPNGAAAAIGDTSDLVNGSTVSNARAEIFGNNDYTYAATLGQKGTMPEKTSVFYPKSGYYISHNSWENENYTDNTWMMFKSGYSSKTHKHADDNSFMLYSKGSDIFVDTGWYNYSSGSRYRDYFISSLAHNTVIVDGKTYSATAENSYKTGIFDYGRENGFEYVAGFNDMYNGVNMDRYFYNLGDAIVIYDNISSNDKHKYSQLFHVAENMEVIENSDSEVLFSLGDTGYNVRIKQLLNSTSAQVIRGDFDKETFGYISRQMSSVESTNTAKFDVTGSNVDLVTLITIENKDGKVENINNIDFSKENMEFNVSAASDYKINLKSRKRISVDNIIISQDDKKFMFENTCTNEDFSYAWYVIDEETNQPVEKSDYSKDNTFEYEFKENGTYLVKAYIKNSAGQKKYKIIGEIAYDEKAQKFVNISKDYPYMNLVYNGQAYKNIGGNKYLFNVEYDYSLDSSITWYIYRDGSYVDTIKTDNTDKLEYEFTLPGDYTIMYYLTTKQGDNEFWNFPIITVK